MNYTQLQLLARNPFVSKPFFVIGCHCSACLGSHPALLIQRQSKVSPFHVSLVLSIPAVPLVLKILLFGRVLQLY